MLTLLKKIHIFFLLLKDDQALNVLQKDWQLNLSCNSVSYD
jgi:hypothetical protein